MNNQEPQIKVNYYDLVYQQGDHKLILSVEWSFLDSLHSPEFFPNDFTVKIKENFTWTEPIGGSDQFFRSRKNT